MIGETQASDARDGGSVIGGPRASDARDGGSVIGGPRASDALYCRSQVAFDFSSDLQFSLTSCSSHYVSWLSKRIDFLLPGIMTPVFGWGKVTPCIVFKQ